MAEIEKEVLFNKTQQQLISDIVGNPNFKHSDWNNEDLSKELSDLRSFIRKHYKTQQKKRCAYCRKDVSVVSALNCHIEHIVPKSLHDKYMFLPKNLCIACADCNQIKKDVETLTLNKEGKKRTLYPRASSAFKIVHPHFDNYEDHIDISRDSWYIDKTIKGHFTIGVCKLNQRSADYGIDEPNEMVQLAVELESAIANGNPHTVQLLKDRIRNLLDQ
ncbi:HNH endonuclease [Pseudoalteromonas sp. SMN1298-MNA-CIBAN-0114]|uniref:HNH endonuclease n=1 Tax=Pseudoalteromonas sp. SMN1298-MNA-CIBAN-0114 TaxID=3140428 RepID=UPI0033232EA5